MKKRRDVSPEEMPRVIALKQGNASWLKIQKETGIPRRIAKRAYEQWQRSQAWEQLKEARTAIAGEEFRKHLDALNQMADSLIGILRVPSAPGETTKADELLAGLWHQDMSRTNEPSEFSSRREPSDRDIRRIERQNRIMLKSLQDHTQGKVRWEAIEEWTKSWNNSIALLSSLNKRAHEVMDGYIKLKPSLRERVEQVTRRKDAVETMVQKVLALVWRGNPQGKSEKGGPLFRVVEQSGSRELAVTAHDGVLMLSFFGDTDLARDVAAICNQAAQNLLKVELQTIEQIARELSVMGKEIEELEGMLDPLRLRPLILSSRCELCPA